MISEIYILSYTAEVIACRNYIGKKHVPMHTRYFNMLVKPESEVKPFFVLLGIRYLYIKRQNVFFVATSAVLSDEYDLQIIECLESLYEALRHFCSIVSADSIRRNLVLVYEILLEIVDNGIIQVLSPEKLQLLVQSEPILPDQGSSFSLSSLVTAAESYLRSDSPTNTGSIGTLSSRKETIPELFVDVLENVTVLCNKEGKAIHSNIRGEVVVRNYIPGQSTIKMGLNENLLIGSDTDAYNIGVHLDECLFGDSVDPSQFECDKILCLTMKRGETSVCKYQTSKRTMQSIPLRLVHKISRVEGSRDIELWLKLIIEIPGNAELLNVSVHIPTTRSTTTADGCFSNLNTNPLASNTS